MFETYRGQHVQWISVWVRQLRPTSKKHPPQTNFRCGYLAGSAANLEKQVSEIRSDEANTKLDLQDSRMRGRDGCIQDVFPKYGIRSLYNLTCV